MTHYTSSGVVIHLGSVGYPVVHLFVDDLFVYVALLFFIRIIVIWQL